MVLSFLVAEFSLLITLIVLYSNTLQHLETVNINMLRYAVDNNCTDGPLQRVLGYIIGSYYYEVSLVQAGLSLVIVALALLIILYLCASPLKRKMPKLFKVLALCI